MMLVLKLNKLKNDRKIKRENIEGNRGKWVREMIVEATVSVAFDPIPAHQPCSSSPFCRAQMDFLD